MIYLIAYIVSVIAVWFLLTWLDIRDRVRWETQGRTDTRTPYTSAIAWIAVLWPAVIPFFIGCLFLVGLIEVGRTVGELIEEFKWRWVGYEQRRQERKKKQ